MLHFCGLGYSRPDGQTSDHWIDVERLTWEPEFRRYVGDAFAPVGLMIDAWAEEYRPGSTHEFPVVVINDLYQDVEGNRPVPPARRGRTLVQETARPCAVPALGTRGWRFASRFPPSRGSTSSRPR